MKKIFPLLLVGIAIFSFTFHLHADDDLEDIGSEKVEEPADDSAGGPFKIKFTADIVGKTKVQNSFSKQHLYFGTGQVEVGFVYYYDPCLEEGANVSVFYQNTYLNWKSNPFFRQKDISTVGFSLGAFSKRLPDWTWSTRVAVNFDNIEYWNLRDYMYYDLLLWGRYEYCDNFGIHIGVLAYTGMKIDLVYPVIGIDWKYNDKWQFNAIFPMNVSIVYNFNKAWSVALAGRFFNERHRVRESEWLSKGLWRYQVTGAELGLYYNPAKWLSANIHAGTTLGGRLKIGSRHYHHRQRIRLDPAPYAGGELTLNF